MEDETTMVLPTGERELVKIFSDFSKQQQTQWELKTKRKTIASNAASIVHCNGKLSSQTRSYLCDIDMLLPQFIQEPGAIKIVKKTASGTLNRDIQRFIFEATIPVDWATLKCHIEKYI